MFKIWQKIYVIFDERRLSKSLQYWACDIIAVKEYKHKNSEGWIDYDLIVKFNDETFKVKYDNFWFHDPVDKRWEIFYPTRNTRYEWSTFFLSEKEFVDTICILNVKYNMQNSRIYIKTGLEVGR